ncbi:MAG TPA: hypothetical protein VLG11_00590 [Candidatus Saccharimonadales bacterium]|nr:hypothetical protein [Candidatus Saccharimonadales bacterium]
MTEDSKKSSAFKKNHKHIVLILAAALLFACILGGTIALGNAINHHTANDPYCRSLDFGGGECIVKVQIYNDTGATYTLKQCSGSFSTPPCKSFADTFTLMPGASREVNGTAEKDPAQPWLVLNQYSDTAGCLNLQFTKDALDQQPVTVPLSKLISCKSFL